MLTDLERKAVVQHIRNLAGIEKNLSTLSDSLTAEIGIIDELLNIEREAIPFDDDPPDPSVSAN
ncbi:MAG: hypothetical protein BECKG1743D_GA0114223_105822 [Candidatus Kentron sp. G]|nr:MAG: hypothetical protein BECKG1743F_GA0114225_106581 [Candidatus Kentron sp. G]VFN04398.1 MAG: hypothetical protein BECKG1743D_GA0114223_105822 [Candidatus Kentron sp. G]VFN07099.1 MAG: hypothetical protein BECKG1743E_GA0114224_111331 [Candidatus Kentron sp. G]